MTSLSAEIFFVYVLWFQKRNFRNKIKIILKIILENIRFLFKMIYSFSIIYLIGNNFFIAIIWYLDMSLSGAIYCCSATAVKENKKTVVTEKTVYFRYKKTVMIWNKI